MVVISRTWLPHPKPFLVSRRINLSRVKTIYFTLSHAQTTTVSCEQDLHFELKASYLHLFGATVQQIFQPTLLRIPKQAQPRSRHMPAISNTSGLKPPIVTSWRLKSYVPSSPSSHPAEEQSPGQEILKEYMSDSTLIKPYSKSIKGGRCSLKFVKSQMAAGFPSINAHSTLGIHFSDLLIPMHPSTATHAPTTFL